MEVASERIELARREAIYRGGRPPRDVRGKTVILVDDGLATGSTMKAAVAALRRQEPAANRGRRPDRCQVNMCRGPADRR